MQAFARAAQAADVPPQLQVEYLALEEAGAKLGEASTDEERLAAPVEFAVAQGRFEAAVYRQCTPR